MSNQVQNPKFKTKNQKSQPKSQNFWILICGFGFWLLIFKFPLTLGF